MQRSHGLLAFCALLCTSCGDPDATPLTLTHEHGKVDLLRQLPGDWERVCVLTPYISMGTASDLLGFIYIPALYSGISVRDDIALLVTVADDRAVGAYEVRRNEMDFASLGADCHTRQQAIFHYTARPDGGHTLKIP